MRAETRYELLHAAVLALADEIEAMHERYVALRRHDPYVAHAYRVAADELRRLVTAVEEQDLPCDEATIWELAQGAHRAAMIAAGEPEEGGS